MTSPHTQGAMEIVHTLTGKGYSTLIVGGWVRDVKVQGLTSDCDIDIATAATPSEIRAAFPRTVNVGEKFGVIIVLLHDETYEVATYRQDIGSADGRHPDRVQYSRDPREDALRRDFTCNGLFYDPKADEVLDFVKGRADIENKILQSIGDPRARFSEDGLRILRVARFAKQLGFSIEEKTFAAACAMAPQVGRISAERIREEILKIVSPPGGGEGLRILDRLRLLPVILGEVDAMKGVSQPKNFHPEGDVFAHTCLALDSLDRSGPALTMATLLHDAGKPQTWEKTDRIRFHGHAAASARITQDVMSRLRFSRSEIEAAVDLVHYHMSFLDIRRWRPATLKRFLRKENVTDHLAMHRADCLASHGNLDHYDYARERLEELDESDLRPPRLITGQDLIAAGYPPGPGFAEALAKVEDAQLDGEITTPKEALSLARTVLDQRSDHDAPS